MLLATIVPIQGYMVVKPTPTSPDNIRMAALSTAAPTESPQRKLIKRNNVQKTLSYIQDQAEACNSEDDEPIDKNVDEKIRQLWQTVTVYCGNNQVKTVTKTKTATATATETVYSDDDDDDNEEYECDDQCWSDYLWRKCCYCQSSKMETPRSNSSSPLQIPTAMAFQ